MHEFKRPEGIKLAADINNNNFVHELEGDIDALKLIDLEKEGLSQYKTEKNNSENGSQYYYFRI